MSERPLAQGAVHQQRHALSLDLNRFLVPVGLFVTVVATAAPNGSYFPSSWGWASLAFLWVAGIGLLVQQRITFGALETAYLGTWSLLLAWTAASLLWSPTATQTMYEIERTLVYVSFALALAIVGRRSVALLLPATLAGITAVATYGLATRLFPDRVGSFDSYVGYRLSEPLGYWNAVSVLAAVGAAVAVGIAARAQSILVRSLAAASTVVLVPVMLFTFGRGAWIALAVGLAVTVAIDPRRLQYVTTLVVIAPWPALALWRIHESPSLTTDFSALADASEEGRTAALTITALAIASAAAMAAFAFASNRVTVARVVRRAYGIALALTLVAIVASVIISHGGPAESARRVVDSIRVSSPNVSGDQTQRLFSLSSNGRLELWETGLAQAREHPIVGSGAGTYERWWLQHRDVPGKARDGHSLYIEVLAELGPLGLALLMGLVAIPIAAAVRVRRDPIVVAALAGFVTLAAHAGVDWDWEVPAVMIPGLACAGALLIVTRTHGAREWTPGRATRGAALVTIGAFVVLSFVTLNGNRYLVESAAAYDRYDVAAALRDARHAQRWTPWSTDALQGEADAILVDGSAAEARRIYQEALAMDAGNWELWFGLALASEGASRERALDRAESLNPLNVEIRQLRDQGVRTATPEG